MTDRKAGTSGRKEKTVCLSSGARARKGFRGDGVRGSGGDLDWQDELYIAMASQRFKSNKARALLQKCCSTEE